MPIVVGHENPGIYNALSTLLLQQQQIKAQREQAAQAPDILSQLRGALNNQPQQTAPRNVNVARSGGASYRELFNGNDIGREQERARAAYALQQLRGQQDYAQQLLHGDQQLANTQLASQYDLEQTGLQQASEMSRLYNKDLPDEITQGLNAGHLRRNPIVQRKLDEAKADRARVATASNLSPAQRAWALADLDQKIRGYQTAVEDVPSNEWPITPQQQLDQKTGFVTLPNGKKVFGVIGTRNGDIDFKDIEDPDLKHEQAKEIKQMELDSKAKDAAAKASEKGATNQQKLLAKRYALDRDINEDANKADIARYQYNKALDEAQKPTESGQTPIDPRPFYNEWKSAESRKSMAENERDRIDAQLNQEDQQSQPMGATIVPPGTPMQPLPTSGGDVSEMYPQQAASSPPDWYVKLPKGAKYTDPTGVERYKQ